MNMKWITTFLILFAVTQAHAQLLRNPELTSGDEGLDPWELVGNGQIGKGFVRLKGDQSYIQQLVSFSNSEVRHVVARISIDTIFQRRLSQCPKVNFVLGAFASEMVHEYKQVTVSSTDPRYQLTRLTGNRTRCVLPPQDYFAAFHTHVTYDPQLRWIYVEKINGGANIKIDSINVVSPAD